MLSISGGMPYLEFGNVSNRAWLPNLRNRTLQSLINSLPNDGLVAEANSDLTKISGQSNHLVKHRNDYHDYPKLNHTYLVRNQEVAAILVEWLQNDCF